MIIGINASFLRKQNTGIGQVTTNFLKKLVEFPISNFQFPNSNEVEFILYLEEDIDLELPKNFRKVVFLPKMYKRDDLMRSVLWQRFELPKRAVKDGCEIFLSTFQCATIMPKKIMHIMIVHDIILEFFPHYLNNLRKKIYWKLTRLAIKKADKIIAISKRTEKDLIANLNIDARKITVSYIAIDEIYAKQVLLSQSEKVINKYNLKPGYIYTGGGLEVRKNTENTIRAYKILLDKNSDMFAKIQDVPLLVVSGKLMPELAPLITDVQALVGSMGLEDNVRILGFVPQEDLPALYKNAIMFLFPSLYEGFGMPVLEAMSQGTPVITSKKSSLPEVGIDAVLYCNPNDIDDIALVMKNILTRENIRTTLSEKGINRSKYFSWDKFTNKFVDIIKEEKNKINRKKRKLESDRIQPKI